VVEKHAVLVDDASMTIGGSGSSVTLITDPSNNGLMCGQ
jgi:hypothetical protein